MLKRDFKDLEMFSDGTLKEDEIELIIRVIADFLLEFEGGMPRRGTFALYAQEKGHGKRAALLTNLEDGAGGGVVEFPLYESSWELVNDAVDEVSEWPLRQRACQMEPRPELFGELPTGIYRFLDTTPVLVMNTTLGRFIAGFRCDQDGIDAGRMKMNELKLLLGVAQVLTAMRDDDVVLQRSAEMLRSVLLTEEAQKKVVDLLKTRQPEVTVWRLRSEKSPRGIYFS